MLDLKSDKELYKLLIYICYCVFRWANVLIHVLIGNDFWPIRRFVHSLGEPTSSSTRRQLTR